TVLGDGNVLVTGGFAYTGILRGAEVYHPAGNAWFATASMDTARIGQTATLLGNGQVLIAGGSNGVSLLASAERYDQSGLDLSQSTLAVTPTSISAGTTASVTLTAKDSDGNLLPQGGLPFSFGLGTGTGSGTFSNLTDNHNGTYAATFTGTSAGQITITAILDGQGITSTLPTITVMPLPPLPPMVSCISPTSGLVWGGTIVTISGTGFQNNSQVFFGGMPATLNGTPTATTLSAITPALQFGPADVMVVNPDGQESVLAGAFFAWFGMTGPTRP